MRFALAYCLYDDYQHLEASLAPLLNQVDLILFIMSDVPWNGAPSDNSSCREYVRALCSRYSNCELFEGHWENEVDQRNSALLYCIHRQIDYTFIIDTDEIYDPNEFAALKTYISHSPSIYAFHLNWFTYWTEKFYRIDPPEEFYPLIAVKTNHFLFIEMRSGLSCVKHNGTSYERDGNPEDYHQHATLVPREVALCHHLSYVRDDYYIQRKIETSSHAPQIVDHWYEKVWKAWTPEMEDLHPVIPSQYKRAIPTDLASLPEVLASYIRNRYMNLVRTA